MEEQIQGGSEPRRLGVIIVGPSGAGKTALTDKLMADPKITSRFRKIPSCTTRSPRGDRTDEHYKFLSPDEFEELREADGFAECASYDGNSYGTRRSDFEHVWANQGLAIFKDMDLRGAEQVRERYPEILPVFLSPTDMSMLEGRLHTRGMPEKVVRRRIDVEAKRELDSWDKYCLARIMSVHGHVDWMYEALKPIMLQYLNDPEGMIKRFMHASFEERTFGRTSE